MGKRKKRLEKGIESIKEGIEEHRKKLEDAKKKGAEELVNYLEKDIERLKKQKRYEEEMLEKQ